MLVVFLTIVSAADLLRQQRGSIFAFFNLLMIMGYFALMVLSESQSRYKCLCMPFMFILVGMLSGPGVERKNNAYSHL